MIITKAKAKAEFKAGNLRLSAVCIDDAGTWCVYDNLKYQRTDHVRVDSNKMDYSLDCAHTLVML